MAIYDFWKVIWSDNRTIFADDETFDAAIAMHRDIADTHINNVEFRRKGASVAMMEVVCVLFLFAKARMVWRELCFITVRIHTPSTTFIVFDSVTISLFSHFCVVNVIVVRQFPLNRFSTHSAALFESLTPPTASFTPHQSSQMPSRSLPLCRRLRFDDNGNAWDICMEYSCSNNESFWFKCVSFCDKWISSDFKWFPINSTLNRIWCTFANRFSSCSCYLLSSPDRSSSFREALFVIVLLSFLQLQRQVMLIFVRPCSSRNEWITHSWTEMSNRLSLGHYRSLPSINPYLLLHGWQAAWLLFESLNDEVEMIDMVFDRCQRLRIVRRMSIFERNVMWCDASEPFLFL